MPDDSVVRRARMSSVALALSPESFFTSSATTAKPRPAGPARAASMVAFKARRFVWREIVSMVPAISAIWRTAASSSPQRWAIDPT